MRRKEIKFLGYTFLVIFLSLVLLYVVTRSGGNELVSDSNSINEQDWTKGSPEAQITLVEYSDFQCPACASYQPAVKDLMNEFSDHVQFAYRHFPLTQHQNAKPTARAAEAAGNQGKFWEMHDLLFERQSLWSNATDIDATVLAYATELGLDLDTFSADYQSSATADRVDADYQSGIDAGVNSTPSFYLNGQKLNNPGGLEGLRETVREAVRAAQNADQNTTPTPVQ